jgi:hypothetical protein
LLLSEELVWVKDATSEMHIGDSTGKVVNLYCPGHALEWLEAINGELQAWSAKNRGK